MGIVAETDMILHQFLTDENEVVGSVVEPPPDLLVAKYLLGGIVGGELDGPI